MGWNFSFLRSLLGRSNRTDMSLIEYKERLRRFNSTEKYLSELQMLKSVLNLKGSEKIMDYGCGLGTAMKYLKDETGCDVYGFDITNELFEGDEFYFRTEIYFKVDIVYFMHSLAHIPNAERILTRAKDYLLNEHGRVVIITPNKKWLDQQDKTNYIPDTTVINHYTETDLKELLRVCGFRILVSIPFGKECGGEHERLCVCAY